MAIVKRYSAFLKAKRGEAKAVKNLSEEVRGSFTPFFEIPNYLPVKYPRDGKGKPKTFSERFIKSCSAIADCWKDQDPAFLDLDFSDDRRLSDGTPPIDFALSELRASGVKITPVITLDRGPEFIRAAKSHALSGTGFFGLRLFTNELALAPATKPRINALLARWGIQPDQVIIFLDFSALPPRSGAETAAVARAWATDPFISQFAGTIFAGSSMPRSEDIQRGLVRIARNELAIWDATLAGLKLGFADYGVTHPAYVDSDTRGAAKIRYPTPREWIIQKGRQLSKELPLQYQDMCRTLMLQEGYRAQESCFGNLEIRRCSASTQRLGSLESWVSNDTNIHLHLTSRIVLQKLAREQIPLAIV